MYEEVIFVSALVLIAVVSLYIHKRAEIKAHDDTKSQNELKKETVVTNTAVGISSLNKEILRRMIDDLRGVFKR